MNALSPFPTRGARKVDPALAAWMARAGIPDEAIAASFRASPITIAAARGRVARDEEAARLAARRRRVRDARLAWCPPGRRAVYLRLRDLLGAATARAIVEHDLVRRFVRLRKKLGAARAAEVALAQGRRAAP